MTNEDRILDRLDKIGTQNTEILVAVAVLQEQTRDLPKRVSDLEKWRWVTTGSVMVAITSMITAWKGAG